MGTGAGQAEEPQPSVVEPEEAGLSCPLYLSLRLAWQWDSCPEEAGGEDSMPASQAPCHGVPRVGAAARAAKQKLGSVKAPLPLGS